MSAHTPGPWKVHDPHDRDGSVTTISKPHDKFSTPIADVINTHKPEGKANLRLIAAAPELLEALREAINSCPRCYGDGTLRQLSTDKRVPCDHCATWRAALAKVAPGSAAGGAK